MPQSESGEKNSIFNVKRGYAEYYYYLRIYDLAREVGSTVIYNPNLLDNIHRKCNFSFDRIGLDALL